MFGCGWRVWLGELGGSSSVILFLLEFPEVDLILGLMLWNLRRLPIPSRSQFGGEPRVPSLLMDAVRYHALARTQRRTVEGVDEAGPLAHLLEVLEEQHQSV